MSKKLIERFEQAVRDHEMAGSQPPEDRPLIEAEYREAKAALVDARQKDTSAPVGWRCSSTGKMRREIYSWMVDPKPVYLASDGPQGTNEDRK